MGSVLRAWCPEPPNLLMTSIKFSILATTFVALACQASYAADDAAERGDRSRVDSTRLERLGQGAKATTILGMEVQDSAHAKVGKVDELALDVEAGRILEVIVSSGGVLGVGDRLIAIPPQSFHLDARAKVLQVDLDKNAFKSAPVFELSKWEDSFESNHVVEVYGFYHKEPYFASRDRIDRPRTTPMYGRIERASKVIGETV
ncbi:MAG: hypothetical protein QOF48_2866, partial [Verrucomicrobiota bacterium]